MKLYVDGEKKKNTVPEERAEVRTDTPLDSYGEGGFKPIKIYVNGAEKKTPDTYARTDAKYGGGFDTYSAGGFDAYGAGGFQSVVPEVDTRTVRTEKHTDVHTRNYDIPVVQEENRHNDRGGTFNARTMKAVVAVLAAACICVIVFAFGGRRQPEVVVETAPPAVAVRETEAPAKAFSDDPDAISVASESVVTLYVYDYYENLIGTGSGFACFENDLIVTNYHVIENAYFILAITESGQELSISRSDDFELMDLAILTTKNPHNLKLLQPGDSDALKKGEKVIAIGSPKGFMNTVSDGIFSGYYDVYLQFTAPISPGSSGGALFNDAGEVVGITTATLLDGQNMNFAVPIEYAEQWYREGMDLY